MPEYWVSWGLVFWFLETRRGRYPGQCSPCPVWLRQTARVQVYRGAFAELPPARQCRATPAVRHPLTCLSTIDPATAGAELALAWVPPPADRKSTRLNSSH